MCLNPVAVAAEDLRDLPSPQQADLAPRRPRGFSEQLDQQFGCARDGHRCASVAKSEIETPYDLPRSDRAVRASDGTKAPPDAAESGLGQRCPKLPAESGRYRVVSVEHPAYCRAFSLQIGYICAELIALHTREVAGSKPAAPMNGDLQVVEQVSAARDTGSMACLACGFAGFWV